MWASGGAPEQIILDVDAALVEVHSENTESAASHFKGGYGFHPMFCFADHSGEALAGILRAVTPTRNSGGDQLAVVDLAIAQLPAEYRAATAPAGEVAELDVSIPGWPPGTRAICRREQPHPGDQPRLWDADGFRHQVTLTNSAGDILELELRQRRRARVENAIKALRDTGLDGMPSRRLPPTRPGWSSYSPTPTCWPGCAASPRR